MAVEIPRRATRLPSNRPARPYRNHLIIAAEEALRPTMGQWRLRPWRMSAVSLARLRERFGALWRLCRALAAVRWNRPGRALSAVAAMRRALPHAQPSIWVDEFGSSERIDYDAAGRPMIRARSRLQAVRLLGYAVARDRMFQMDMLRRGPAGRLAELLGERAVASDRRARVFGFERVAAAAIELLPACQRELLDALSEGVNGWLKSAQSPGFEFELLHCAPEPWKPSDSLLVQLGLFDQLGAEVKAKRTLTVMEKTLPPELARFFCSDEDPFPRPLVGGDRVQRPLGDIPIEALAKAIEGRTFALPPRGKVASVDQPPVGSNAWVMQTESAAAGRTLCANDMHLPLRVPNLAYAAGYDYGIGRIHGFLVPGLPGFVSGSSDRIAWGITNFNSDNLDLVMVRTAEQDAESYFTSSGPRRFVRRCEHILVRDRDAVDVELRDTCWGPIAPDPLLGRAAAYRWAALDPRSLDFGLCLIEEKESAVEALEQARQSGGPPLNVTVCDRDGNIGWTVSGRFPDRSGQYHHCALEGELLPDAPVQFVNSAETPTVLNPACKFIATANNRTIGADFPHDLGRSFTTGFRAHRIAARLSAARNFGCSDAIDLQLDVDPGFFDFYRNLLVDLIRARNERPKWAADILLALSNLYDGEKGVGGTALLAHLRINIARALLAVWCSPCQEAEPEFEYHWPNFEPPLRAILIRRDEKIFPFADKFPDWEAYIAETARQCRRRLLGWTRRRSLARVRWKDLAPSRARHPLSALWPELSPLLDMPPIRQPGNPFTVRAKSVEYGAVTRLVVRPGEAAWLQAPAGQSGNPLSPHYRDQQADWIAGRPTQFGESATVRVHPRRRLFKMLIGDQPVA
jgi:penicillin amidase